MDYLNYWLKNYLKLMIINLLKIVVVIKASETNKVLARSQNIKKLSKLKILQRLDILK